ncbi:MAG: nitroreductase family protein [Deltaproteobacteria bacterium]|jgi:nitroreductase|nr:nitroreductase family protein [Deltaproteobacteria bacterium]
MSDLMNTIQQRRSIRRFQERDLPDDILTKLLEAARWAPSWANTQCWNFVVVRDNETKRKIQETVSPRNPSSKAIVNAPVLLVVCGQLKKSGYYNDQYPTKFGDWFMYDLGLATQNLCLAAHDSGLGTVIVGLFEHDKVGEIIKLPPEHEVLVLIPVGYPDHDPSPPKRRELDEFVFNDSF